MASDRIVDHIDPELVVQEATYGFVMALTLLTTAQLGIFQYGSRQDLILAIIGMDFVWGVIDMYIFYRVDILAYRRRLLKYIDMTSQKSRDEKKELLSDEFHGTIFELASDKDKEQIKDIFIDSEFTDLAGLNRSTRHYALNAAVAFLVTFATVIPSVLALMIFETYWDALLSASLVSVCALFFTSYYLAPGITRMSRVTTGLVTALVALIFTVFAAYLGG